MKAVRVVGWRAAVGPKLMMLCLWLLACSLVNRTRAENRADYKYEDYLEQGGRIHIETQGAYFDTEVKPSFSLEGNFIYDGISGATPTGTPFLHGETSFDQVPFSTALMTDTRRAGFLQAAIKTGVQTFSPQISYSGESDYESIGVSLSDAIDFNEKNTTLSIGISHAFDQVLPNEGELQWVDLDPASGDFMSIESALDKDTTDVLLGVTQLLGPNDLFSAFLTLGYSSGFLNDPYKRAYFDDAGLYYTEIDGLHYYTVFPENRPDTKFRQVLFLTYQHYFEKLNSGLQTTYRFYHDDFGIIANTASLQWNQKIGKIFIVAPLFRYYIQTAADFYNTHFPGDPYDQGTMPISRYFSADYRLSALDSITYGVSLSARIHEHFSLDLAYKRYEMRGRDSITFPGQYPKANVFTGGLTLWY